VLTTIAGIPAHPLLIHAAVVFIPLLILGAIVYSAWPPFRDKITWAVVALAIIAPLSALFAKLSGENLKNELIAKKLTSPQLLVKIDQHNGYGDNTFWWTLALGILTLVLVVLTRRSAATAADPSETAGPSETAAASGTAARSGTGLRVAGTVVTLVVGIVVGYYVYRTGDTGAHMVWQI